MERLRSPKHLVGPAQGLPDLTFRAWWEARFGPEGWEALGHIPRADWAAYLAWFGRVTGAQVRPRTRLTDLRPEGDLIAAALESEAGARTVHARQVVLATGREGQARARIPAPFAPWLGGRVLHSSSPIDFAALAGRRVVVIGLSASAFDNACEAAEHGAEVTLLGRAETTPIVNKMKQTVYPGFAHGFPDLPARERLAWLTAVARSRTAPPRHTVQRAARAGVRLVEGAETERVEEADGRLTLFAGPRRFEADLVILGTGFRFDMAAAPELAGLRPRIAFWRDLAPDAAEDERLDCPALGPGFELTALAGADPAGLGRIRIFTHAAQPSLGNLANDIPQASEGAERLARHLARDLFLEDADHHRAALLSYAEPELLGDEWTAPNG
jgi:cation diffusion facilitator CzcD-associated flavoprotein CzcO